MRKEVKTVSPETSKNQKKLRVSLENAQKFWDWIKTRGGIAVWRSVNLSNPGASWSTPAMDEKGNNYPKPTWQAANEPERIIIDPNDVEVYSSKEVKRFHVAIRRGSQGLTLKLTDGGSRRVERAVAKAEEDTGKDAWYEFDHYTQEAVIYVADEVISLTDYAKKQGWDQIK